jgi:transcriptional regulator
MILFNGPVHHYVTPKFYVETKPSTGKVVPTWNYSAVQAYGKAKIFFSREASTGDFLKTQINDLSQQSEEKIMGYDGKEGRDTAWTVEQAPEKYIDILKKAIIGIEIEVTRLAGKWKMSQELGEGDREGTLKGFENIGSEEGKAIAKLIGERAEIMKAEKAVKSS